MFPACSGVLPWRELRLYGPSSLPPPAGRGWRGLNYGVVPIENSTEGAVNHTLDLFADSPLKICAQILLRIENALMARGPREEITKLCSHPQVFGQCRGWIHRNFPNAEIIEVSSTTKAATIATEPHAAVLEESTQDRATNTTRFLVLSHNTCPPTGNDRTSIMFSGARPRCATSPVPSSTP
jgi:chorismate mutase/prephenate dehydratase